MHSYLFPGRGELVDERCEYLIDDCCYGLITFVSNSTRCLFRGSYGQ